MHRAAVAALGQTLGPVERPAGHADLGDTVRDEVLGHEVRHFPRADQQRATAVELAEDLPGEADRGESHRDGVA